MMWKIRWTLANYAMRFTFWLMPESPPRRLYVDVIERASKHIVEAVETSRRKA